MLDEPDSEVYVPTVVFAFWYVKNKIRDLFFFSDDDFGLYGLFLLARKLQAYLSYQNVSSPVFFRFTELVRSTAVTGCFDLKK